MKQFILRDEPDEDGLVYLTGEDFHYLARVRRLKAGSAVDCRLPSGKEAVLLVNRVEKDRLTAECTPKNGGIRPQNPLPPIILFQSMAKGVKMDEIIRKAGETGVSEVVPFYSERSVPRPDRVQLTLQARLERWRRILKTARQQSGSAVSAQVREPVCGDQIFEYWERIRRPHKEALALLIHEIPLEKGGFHRYLDKVPDMIVLAVGPEGGFSPFEAEAFVGAGFKPVTLGDTILRVENAALYSIAVIRTLIFERQSWIAKTN
jgi:16S rRNA (uracil1498-N3)-methyltransferase